MKRADAIEVHYLTTEQKELLKETIEPVYEEAENIVGKRLMEELYELQEPYK